MIEVFSLLQKVIINTKIKNAHYFKTNIINASFKTELGGTLI